jgi:hypothetical protein
VFIDFKSAYNAINKKNLFEILKRLEIYEDDELKFLRVLYQNTYLQSEEQYIKIEEGVE